MTAELETPRPDAAEAEPPAEMDDTRNGLPQSLWIPAIVLIIFAIVLLFSNGAIVT